MLCHAHIRQLIRSVSAGTTRCCLVFDGYGSSRKDKEQLYSTCGVSSNSFLNGSYNDTITNIFEHPLGWRWEMDRGYFPIYSWSPMAPVELETLISCNCIARDRSRNNCSCFKSNVKCV